MDSRRGWAVVAAAFLSCFAVFVPTYSFGIFFKAMSEDFDAGNSATATVFAVATCIYFVGGIVTGRLGDRYGPRRLVLAGAVALTTGLVLTSLATELWMAYLTYGLGVGIGVACAYVPLVAPVSGWFDHYRTVALGIAVAGIGSAWLVGPPLARWLIDRWSWQTAYVVIALISLSLLLVAAVLTQAAPNQRAVEAEPISVIARKPSFGFMYAAAFVGSISLFMPFVFLVKYATDEGLSDGQAAILLQVLGGTSVVGRLALGALAGKREPIRLYQVCFFLMGASMAIWLVAGSSFGMLILFCLVLGLGYGGFIALAPAVTARLYGVRGLGGMLGALYTSSGFGGLVGPPLGGWLLDRSDSYTPTIVLALVTGLGGAVVLLRVRIPAPEAAVPLPVAARPVPVE